jgi:hypothetical protein
MDWYLQADRLAALKEALATADHTNKEVKHLVQYLDPDRGSQVADFPLLILHGFADIAACGGPEAVTDLGMVAEIDLALLAEYGQ